MPGRAFIYLIPLSCLFVASLLLATTVSVKIILVLGMTLPAGIIVYPLVSVLGDIITEVYGYKVVRVVIWSGLASLALLHIVFISAIALPFPDFWVGQEAYSDTLGAVPRIALASIVAYPFGELVNAIVLSRLKLLQNGKWMSARFVASTMLGQATDSIVFVTIAFAGVIPTHAFFALLFFSWALKVLWETLALPISLRVARLVKRLEGGDVWGNEFKPLEERAGQ